MSEEHEYNTDINERRKELIEASSSLVASPCKEVPPVEGLSDTPPVPTTFDTLDLALKETLMIDTNNKPSGCQHCTVSPSRQFQRASVNNKQNSDVEFIVENESVYANVDVLSQKIFRSHVSVE